MGAKYDWSNPEYQYKEIYGDEAATALKELYPRPNFPRQTTLKILLDNGEPIWIISAIGDKNHWSGDFPFTDLESVEFLE